jgi:hypothetical protein
MNSIRRLAAALWLDAWLASLLVFELLLRLVGRRALDELTPFALHSLHAPLALVGALGCSAPATCWAPRVLSALAPASAFFDALACVWHANLFAAEFGRHSAGERSECTVLAALSLLLAASSLNVSAAARRRADEQCR